MIDQDYTKVLIKDLTLEMSIGVHEHERQKAQRVIVNAEIFSSPPVPEDLGSTVNYEIVVNAVIAVSQSRHFDLVETLAEEIARICLNEGPAISAVVRVVKPDIINSVEFVGVEISRSKS